MEDVRHHVKSTAKLMFRVVGVLVLFLVLGNLAIYGASVWARGTTSGDPVAAVKGIENLRAVDDRVWRGGAPTTRGYRQLAERGTKTVIDLRAEEGLSAEHKLVGDLGMKLVHIPIRDGQTPSADKVNGMLEAIQQSPGLVFVHCGAGVGRTGTMIAAYLVASGDTSSRNALRRNLAVGPPSLEQMLFVAKLRSGELARPNLVFTATSRLLDAPRRLWSRLG